MNSAKDQKNYMLKLASCALKKAGSTISELQHDNEKLSSEIVSLKHKLDTTNRLEETMKLAQEMHSKGLIKKAEIEAKAYEMLSFDDEAIKVLELTLSGQEKVAEDGVSSLSEFYVGNDFTGADPMEDAIPTGRLMADTIMKLADEM